MPKVRILVVGYGAREAAMVDAFTRSRYDVDLYIADRQKNPFNTSRAREHRVIRDLNVPDIVEFAREYQDRIDFGIVSPEDPIIAGVRDSIEEATGIPVLCPTKDYAIEGSKVRQRYLLREVCPEMNPQFQVFDPESGKSIGQVKDSFYTWLKELKNQVAIKPDRPGQGKGVGVWEDHFRTPEDAWEHFLSIYENGSAVIVEEKIDGEEFSLQFFSDGRGLQPTPAVRDFKRRYAGDKGPNTGGMASYKDSGDILPFMTEKDYRQAVNAGYKLFNYMNRQRNVRTTAGRNINLWGVPFYFAFTVAKGGLKVFEINSRPGDPEFINILPIIQHQDFVDICYDMINGTLRQIHFQPKATVGIYLVPEPYPEKDSVQRKIDLSEAYRLVDYYDRQLGPKLRVYPASMEQREDGNYALSSRTVYCFGIADTIEEARNVAMEGIKAIPVSGLAYREDAATSAYIQRSIEHVNNLIALNRA